MLWSRRVVYSHTTLMLRPADLSGNDCMLNDLSLCFQFDSILYYVPKFCMIINNIMIVLFPRYRIDIVDGELFIKH